jgi:hypothetical protein
VHPKSAYHCDMTGVDLSIHLLPYSISGTAIDIHGAGIANVLISAGDLLTTTTDLDGNYALRAYDGTYTLTPTLEGYSFEPATRTVDVPPDATGQHFVGTSLTPMHVAGVSLTKAGTGPWRLTARGYVHDAAHAPLPGVQVTGQWRLPDGALRYRQFTTAAQGGWQFLLNASLAGQYRFCVVNLVKAGYVYATADDHPSPPCKLIALP